MEFHEYQEVIDKAFRFVNDDSNDAETIAIVDGLLDLCASYAQGFDYPSYDEEEVRGE